MKNKELFELLHGLKEVSNYPGAKFAFCVAKNIAKLTAECTLLESVIKPSDAFTKYDGKRIELAKQFCDKNEDGTAKMNGNAFDLTAEGMSKFNTAHAELEKEYTDVLEERNKQIAGFNILLDEKSTVTVFKISEDNLPEAITAAQLVAIMPIIEEV